MKFSKFFSWSLRARLVAQLLVTVTIVMTVVGFAQYRSSSAGLEQAMQNKAYAISSMLMNISGYFVANYDLTTLEQFVDQSMKDPDVSYAVFYDSKGKALTEKVKKPESIDGLMNIDGDLKADGKLVGRVSLGFRKDAINAVKKKNLSISVMGIAVAILIVFVLMWFSVGSVTKAVIAISSELEQTGKHLLSSAQNMSNSSSELMAASANQADFVRKTASTVAEFDSSLLATNQNAQKSVALAKGSSVSAERGQAVVAELLESFNSINATGKKLNEHSHDNLKNLNAIVQMIERIGEQTKEINNIVFQTKILSFNASVEAARAGEHGRGFSIVAEEIRKLAEMSGGAAQNISSLLEESVTRAAALSKHSETSMLAITKESATCIRVGEEKVKQVSEVFKGIADNIVSTVTASSDIAGAVNDQSKGISDINLSMDELSTTINQSKEVSELQAGLANGLLTQSEQIDKIAHQLRSIVRGDGTDSSMFPNNKVEISTMDPPSSQSLAA